MIPMVNGSSGIEDRKLSRSCLNTGTSHLGVQVELVPPGHEEASQKMKSTGWKDMAKCKIC